MSTDLSVLEVKASEALYRTAVVEDRASVLEAKIQSGSQTRLVTSEEITSLHAEINELWNIMYGLQRSVEQLNFQLNSLAINQLL